MTELEREKLDQLLLETNHIVQFTDRGWTVAHPIRERLNGSLFECRVFWDADDPGVRGKFELDTDGNLGGRYDG